MIKAFNDNLGNELQFHGPLNGLTIWHFRNGVCQKVLFTSLDVNNCNEELESLRPTYVGRGYKTLGDINLFNLMKKAVHDLRVEMHHA